MKITPFSRQMELIQRMLDRETTVIVYGGGIRGGKTFGMLIGMFLYFRLYPGSRAVIVRDSVPTLFRNTVPVYNKLTPVKQVDSMQQMMQPISYRQSQLLFFGENYSQDKELNRWKGLESNMFLLEEFNELTEDSFNKAIERAGSWVVPGVSLEEQPPPKIVCTCNPSRGYVKEKIYDKYLSGTLPENWVYIPALMEENPYIPAAYKENLKNLPPREYNTFVLGDWDSLVLENLFLEEFDEVRHVRPCVYNPELEIYLSWDFNISNTCLVIQYDGQQVNVLGEYHQRGGLEKLCVPVKADFPEAYFYINGDASGASGNAFTSDNESGYEIIKNVLDLSYNQFHVPASNPSHEGSYKLSNLAFRHRQFSIDPSCTGLIRDLQNVQIINKGQKLQIDKSNPTLTHHSDPLRYFIHAELRGIVKELGLQNLEYYREVA